MAADAGRERQAAVARAHRVGHHFDDAEQEFESGKLGMWIFLATEILLFGGLFCAYAVYRSNHPEIFVYAHRYLDKTLGALNTAVLICSSFTMALAVRAAQLGRRRQLVGLLGATIALAACFLAVKGVEYEQKWKEGLLWGAHFHAKLAAAKPVPQEIPVLAGAAAEDRSSIPPAAVGPPGLARPGSAEVAEAAAGPPHDVQVFFAVYFLMTGLHGVHVIVGMILLAWMMVRAARGEFSPAYVTPVDLTGLYWHLVDLIWIFLFPLLYLIR